MNNAQPNPDVVRRLDALIGKKLATSNVDSTGQMCLYLVGVFSAVVRETTGEVIWSAGTGSDFSRRVIVRAEGLTIANFLCEVQHSYGDHAYELVIGAINGPRVTEWLDRQDAASKD